MPIGHPFLATPCQFCWSDLRHLRLMPIGHPFLATTHRGDLHLTQGIPQVLASYERVTESLHLNHLVVDREAMAADAPFTIEHRGAHPDDHSQDEPI